MEPLIFEPLAMERVWGGRSLERLYGKPLPPGAPVGETWEIVDRASAQSVVHRGKFKGRTLHELWCDHREEVFGTEYRAHSSQRFPLLIKLLDARERLSLQVHPPVSVASALGGEPKTEMWYFLHTQPGSSIYAGLHEGVTRDQFEQALSKGAVEPLVRRLEVETGQSIFIPSGRLHAIGEGNVIIEVQQNSDTTYRVFDWNRLGLDGRPRALHPSESLASIDFADHHPEILPASASALADCPFFKVTKITGDNQLKIASDGRFVILAVASGRIACADLELSPAQFALLPPSLLDTPVTALETGTSILAITLPVE